jgi:hypothetical protein
LSWTYAMGRGDLMPRFFFHIVQGDWLQWDKSGVDFPFAQAARARAIAMARELRETRTETPRYILVQDETGTVIFRVLL